MNVARRAVLAGLAGVTTTLAGCNEDSEGATGPSTATPSSTPDENAPDRRVSAGWSPGPGEWAIGRRYDTGGNRYNPHASVTAEPDVVWSTEYDGSLAKPRSFAIADGKWYNRSQSELVAVDTTDGSRLWSEAQSEFGTVRYVDGRLYHHTGNEVEARTLDGDVEWQTEARGFIGEMDGYVYVPTEVGVAWHHADTGERLGSADGVPVPGYLVDGVFYSVAREGIRAYEHDGKELTRLWQASSEDAPIQGTWAVITDERVYVRKRDGGAGKRLDSYDHEGQLRETRTWDDSWITEVAVADGIEYLLLAEQSSDGSFERSHVRATDGEETVWERTFDPLTRNLVVDGDRVYVESGEELLALDVATGDTRWQTEHPVGVFAVVDGSIYVLAPDELHALRP